MAEAPRIVNATAPAYVPDNRWPEHLAEHDASASYSAAFYQQVEHVGVFPMIVPERELGEVERQILLRDVMKASDDPALKQSPETIDVLGMDLSPNVLTGAVSNCVVRVAVFSAR
jgi:hypothetical protein